MLPVPFGNRCTRATEDFLRPVPSSATLTVALYVYANDRGRTDIAFSIASVLMLLTLVINLTAALTGRKLKKNGGTQ